MAHMITEREGGFFEFGYRGEPAWHGLGQELSDDADIDTWKIQAGLDWTVKENKISYSVISNGEVVNKIFPDKKVLYRSDNTNPLSIVGEGFKIVQPGEVLEFFRDLVANHGMKLSAAGSLFGGTRFWATAETGNSSNVIPNDAINGFLLLTTSVDSTLATTARFCATRVVCNNTMAVALNEKNQNVIRKTHKSEWDPTEVKINLGLLDESWETFMLNNKQLTTIKMSDKDVLTFFQDEFFNPELAANDQTWGVIKKINCLQQLYSHGAGAEMGYGTAWGALNAVTNLFTHGDGRKRNESRAFWDSYYGSAAETKSRVYNNLLKLAA